MLVNEYLDADWAGCIDDRISMGGFAIFLGNNLVSWNDKKQATVSWSSTEVEYKTLTNTTAKIIWIQMLLQELQVPSPPHAKVWVDNMGVKYLAFNPIFYDSMYSSVESIPSPLDIVARPGIHA
jgi:hypothetical protein